MFDTVFFGILISIVFITPLCFFLAIFKEIGFSKNSSLRLEVQKNIKFSRLLTIVNPIITVLLFPIIAILPNIPLSHIRSLLRPYKESLNVPLLENISCILYFLCLAVIFIGYSELTYKFLRKKYQLSIQFRGFIYCQLSAVIFSFSLFFYGFYLITKILGAWLCK